MTGPALLCHDGSANADRALARAAALLRPMDAVVVHTHERRGPVASAVPAEARRLGASVIVVGAGAERGPGPPAPGGVVAALVRRADRPVLVVGAGDSASVAIEPIFICYDGSPPARRALATAADLLAGRAATVAAFMPAVDDVALLRSSLPWPVSAAVEDEVAQLDREEGEAPARLAAEGARAAAAAGFAARPLGISGADAPSEGDEPWRPLVAAALAERAACMVVGRRSPVQALAGTALHVVAHAGRPVLVVPA